MIYEHYPFALFPDAAFKTKGLLKGLTFINLESKKLRQRFADE
jgi:hypothetical protein